MERLLFTLTVLLSVSGCLTIGSQRFETPTEAKVGLQDQRVVVFILDGLNHDTLDSYLKTIADLDHEPRWASGLSLLARNQFKLANAQSPMSALPAFSPVAEATMLTGKPPIWHGILSSKYAQLPADGPEVNMDFQSQDVRRSMFAASPAQDSEMRTSPLIQTPLWPATLHQTNSTASLFVPFGHGTHWYLPAQAQTLGDTIFNNRISKQLTILIDDKVEELAENALSRGEHLTLIRFSGIKGHSCTQSRPGCVDASKDLGTRQKEALIHTDERLWRLIRNYQMRHPEAFNDTVFVFTGTVGTLPRPEHTIGNADFTVDSHQIQEQLIQSSTSDCEALPRDSFRLSTESGFALLQVPDAVAGQKSARHKTTRCILNNFRTMAEALNKDSKLDAYVTLDTASGEADIVFSSSFLEKSGSYGRRRIEDKLKSLLKPTAFGQAIGLLFLAPPLIFSGSAQDLIHRGSLRSESIKFPFLIANKHMSQTAKRQLEGASIDHVDLGPTITGLLDPSFRHQRDFIRHPLLVFSEADKNGVRTLSYTRAQRNIYDAPEASKALTVKEDAAEFTILIREGPHIWPPDTFTFSLNGKTAVWSNETQTFDSSDCGFTNEKDGRSWRCQFNANEASESALITVSRDPSESGVGQNVIRYPLHFKSKAPRVEKAHLACIDGGKEVALEIKSEFNITSVVLAATLPESKQQLTPFNHVRFTQDTMVKEFCSSPEKCHVNPDGSLRGLATRIKLTENSTLAEVNSIVVCNSSGGCTRTPIARTFETCLPSKP